jgi:hypothetical protein
MRLRDNSKQGLYDQATSPNNNLTESQLVKELIFLLFSI